MFSLANVAHGGKAIPVYRPAASDFAVAAETSLTHHATKRIKRDNAPGVVR
jgi:hypothetical protein